MSKNTLYVGLDTDKKHIDVALAEALPGGEVRYWGQVANEARAVAGWSSACRPAAGSWRCATRPGRAATGCIGC